MYRIGPLKISIDQVRIGFSTAVIIIPIHLLIVLLFKTASPKPDKNAQKYGPEEATEVTPTDAEKGMRNKDVLKLFFFLFVYWNFNGPIT